MIRFSPLVLALAGLFNQVAVAHAAPTAPEFPLVGGDATGHAQYVGISWLGAPSSGGGPVAYAFTRDSLWDAQLPQDFRLLAPMPPPARVHLPLTAPGATGEIAMGVVQILEDTRGDGKLDYTYEEINSADGPVRAAVRDTWVLFVHNLNAAG
ncbi:MAG TPA: hypothetical protein VFH51_00850, partial [Myxococcota bacterium]|nr:hypothetical protein [Myxococcota bacterium]